MGAIGLQVLVLGDLAVFQDGVRVEVPGSRKTRALLGYLALQTRPVTREHLCEMLWPHPDNPRAALRWSLSKLRPVLNSDENRLLTDRNTVQVDGMSDRVDLLRVNQLLRQPIDQVPTDDLLDAASIFKGELLEGLEIPDGHRFNEWLIAYGETARKSHRQILETLTARLADEPEAALVHARGRVSLDPLDEGAHLDVVRLLGSLGRSAEARDQAERCRAILAAELGVAPGPEWAEALGTVRSAGPAPVVPAPVAAQVLPEATEAGLFGRAEECVRIEHFLASPGKRRVLFLEGESGIGKSRLLGELKTRAASRDVLVLAGRSWEVGAVRPFGVWLDLLEDLPGDLVPDDVRDGLGPLVSPLGEAAEPSWSMERIGAGVIALIDHLHEAGRTTVLLFDDIQWMDPASAELLGALTGMLAKGSLTIGCAGRPGEFADNEPARLLVRTWNREGLLERLALGPLADQEAAALARAHAGSADVEDAVASCGGNPLYLIESARSGAGSSGEGVVGLVADRFAVLDEPTRDIVDWAALMGRAFPAARLGALLDRPLDDLLRQTETLERHGILIPHGHGWDFAHDLLRRTALGLISGPRRALMHRRTALLLADEPDPSGTLAGELAFHAAHGGLPETAAQAAVAAGDRALRLAAFDDAWRVAESGLHEADKLAEPASIETSVELLRVQVLAGMGRRAPLEMFTRLTGLSRRAAAAGLTPTVRTARWLLSVVAEESGEFDQARAHSLKAEEATREADPATRLMAVANTARCLLQLERDQDKAAELLDQARRLSEDLDQPVLDIPWGTGLLHLMNGQPNEARAALEQGVEMAAAEENHWAHFECLSRLSMLDLSVGNGAAVLRRDAQLRPVAEKLGEGSELALADALLALAGRQMGYSPGELETALEALREADSKGLLSYALVEAGQIEFIYGNLEKAAAWAEEAAEAAGEVGRHHQLRRAMKLFERVDKMMK